MSKFKFRVEIDILCDDGFRYVRKSKHTRRELAEATRARDLDWIASDYTDRKVTDSRIVEIEP